MGDKIVKSKNLYCQPVVFPSLSLLNSKLTGSDVDLLSLNSPKTRTKITRPIKTLTAKLAFFNFQGYKFLLRTTKVIMYFKGHKTYLLHLKVCWHLLYLNELNRMMT